MKSLYLSLFCILTFLVITSKASIKGLETEDMPIEGGGYKVWLPEVNGYDKNDAKNGYSGLFDRPVSSLRMGGGQPYTVHIVNKELGWFRKVNGSDIYDILGFAGHVNGELTESIDAIVIADDVEYSVHVMGEDWLPPIHGNPHDLDDIPFLAKGLKIKEQRVTTIPKQYAGTLGKPIDAVMIKDRVYATSFFSQDRCFPKGGTCMNQNQCEGTIKNKLCPGSADNKCCIPKDMIVKSEKEKNKTEIYIIIIFALVAIIAILGFTLFIKKWSKKNIPNTVTQNLTNTINQNAPPTYDEAIDHEGHREETLNTNNTNTNTNTTNTTTTNTTTTTTTEGNHEETSNNEETHNEIPINTTIASPSATAAAASSSSSTTPDPNKVNVDRSYQIKIYPNPPLKNEEKS